MATLKKIAQHKCVADVSDERASGEGIFVGLKDGFCHPHEPGLHGIHEDTVRECWSLLEDVKPCTCEQCKAQATKVNKTE